MFDGRHPHFRSASSMVQFTVFKKMRNLCQKGAAIQAIQVKNL